MKVQRLITIDISINENLCKESNASGLINEMLIKHFKDSGRTDDEIIDEVKGKIKDREERRKFINWLKELEYGKEGYNLPEPDLIFLLYLDPAISQILVDKKAASREYSKTRDGHEKDIAHLHDAAKVFREIAEEEKDWYIIDCGENADNGILPKEIIHEKIWNIVKDKL